MGHPSRLPHRPGRLCLADQALRRPRGQVRLRHRPGGRAADATPFDIIGAELSHHGGDCSFETFLRQYQLEDPLLWGIARIVHEADLADERYDAPEAPGLDVVLRGLSLVADDDKVLELTGPLFDGLYEYLKRAAILGGNPSD